MKPLFTLLAATLVSFTALAESGSKVTLTGEGKCLKCALKKSDKCQNVVEVKEGEKTTLYKLVGETSKKFHGELCSETKKITVSGSLEKKGDDLEVTVAKIEAVK